jgi:RNase adaptor protein for sRNA GlmZ degradation
MLRKNLNLVIITGLSGAGKTQAFTEFGRYGLLLCGNLPPAVGEICRAMCTISGQN